MSYQSAGGEGMAYPDAHPPMKPHALYPPAPSGYSHPADVQLQPDAAPTNTGKATAKAGAYGGSELGSLIGGAVGPPVIGNIVGNLVGERFGEKIIKDTGFDKVAGKTGDNLAKVIGRDNVNKIGEITLTALGYSEHEECICCPCLPASQILLVITLPFFFFNFYKLGVGVSWESSCSLTPPANSSYAYNSTDPDGVYPCEHGFGYLVVSGGVWLAILPFWICGLFGNCWRQSCCCLCDPVVLCSTLVDFIKRCCCECGRLNICELLWLGHCLFHLAWAASALSWLSGLALGRDIIGDTFDVPGWSVPTYVIETVIASVFFDFLLAGSEVFHRIRRYHRGCQPKDEAAEPNPEATETVHLRNLQQPIQTY